MCNGTSKTNFHAALATVRTVLHLLRRKVVSESDILILTFYSEDVSVIQALLKSAGVNVKVEKTTEVNNVRHPKED
jgi:hypothetical protein